MISKTIKVALLGGATTELIENPLTLALEAKGMASELYCSEYNAFAREMIDANSDAVRFKPDVALIVNTVANIPKWPSVGDDLNRIEELIEERLQARKDKNWARADEIRDQFADQ